MVSNNLSTVRQVAFIGNYLPRKCGIATFTTDLCEALAAQYPESECTVLAMNDLMDEYDYPERVRFEIPQEDLKSYLNAAEFLNLQNIDLVCLQHEFGIFGGQAGSHILTLLRGLRMPVVTTLHTILTNPDANQRLVMQELAQLSDRLVVMSERAVQYLQEIYNVPAEKIDLIPHGIPDVPFVDPNFYKDKFNVEGKQVLLTFGLLSPNKGIETVIKAFPKILEKHPDVVYLVLGTTHPNVKRLQGESYRQSLESLAVELGVEEHIIFHDQFVSLEELVEFIGAADIYVTPYLNPSQIVSGTLAYTVGAGKAVISTPYWYSEEILAGERGLIVPFQDSDAIADQVIYLLENEVERHAIRKRAYLFGREMVWEKVAQRYMESFGRARQERIRNPQPGFMPLVMGESTSGELIGEQPMLNLNHLLRMTDGKGIFQHAVFNLPNYSEGYTTDDNARALVLALLLDRFEGDNFIDIEALASRYLSFIWYAFNAERGRFRNFLAFEGSWLEEVGSEDSHGRAMWSLGTVLGHTSNAGLKGVAARLFGQALSATLDMKSPRAWAFTLLGIHEYLRRFSGDRAVSRAGQTLAERLMDLYRQTCKPGWYWFEDIVTYNNATLPQALLLSSQWMGRADMAQVALESLYWLAEIQTCSTGYFVPVGSNGFFPLGGEKARFDQQPIEASAMVSACLEAYRMTGDKFWNSQAQNAFLWFLGQNDIALSLYDPITGGCHDGLHPDRLNENQGAESTLAFLMAQAEIYLASTMAPFHLHTERSLPFSLSKNNFPVEVKKRT
jgi:glycosyltransferase involved in cell wall biosynthesis